MPPLALTDTDEIWDKACGEDTRWSRSAFSEVDSFPNATDFLLFVLSFVKAFKDAASSIAPLGRDCVDTALRMRLQCIGKLISSHVRLVG